MTDLLPQLVAYLLPFLLGAANGDEEAARQTAVRLLQAYGPLTEPELILAAHTVAFSLATLESLRDSATDPDMPAKARRSLRNEAEKLSRAAERTRTALGKWQARADRLQPAPAPAVAPTASLPEPVVSAETAPEDAFAQDPGALLQTLGLSRQQRRFLERRAEKLRRFQQQEAARTAKPHPTQATPAAPPRAAASSA